MAFGIVIPHSWESSALRFNRSLRQAVLPPDTPTKDVEGGGTIGRMRNAGVMWLRREYPGLDGVVFVDADMVFPSDAIECLVASAREFNEPTVVSGLCRKRRRPFPVVAFQSEIPYLRFYSMEMPDAPVALVEVDGAGGAFLYVPAEIFHAIPPPWFAAIEDVPPGDYLSEDLNFCRKVRNAGFKIFIDRRIIIGHCVQAVVTTDEITGEAKVDLA